jgi:hypothetical protein
VTERWVKSLQNRRWHLLARASVRVSGHVAYHQTVCGLVVPGKVFRDGFPPGADCSTCLQVHSGWSDSPRVVQ